MGKLKDLSYSCWEYWRSYEDTGCMPDWEHIARVHDLDVDEAKEYAYGWEDELRRQDMEGF